MSLVIYLIWYAYNDVIRYSDLFHIPVAIFNIRVFKFVTHLEVSVIFVPRFVRLMDLYLDPSTMYFWLEWKESNMS